MKRKFQKGGKGVILNSDVINRQVPVRLNTGEVIYVDANNIYSDADLLENKATTFNSKKQIPNSNKLKKQLGGTGKEVLIEDGELFKDEFGNIQESKSFSHDDEYLLHKGRMIEVEEGEGGEIVDDAVEVVSDSYEQVKSGGRENSKTERKIAFKPKEANKLLKDVGMSWFNTRRTMSPAELIKTATEQTEKHFNLGDDDLDDEYSVASKNANSFQAPTEEDIFDLIFDAQEKKKGNSLKNDMQYGGSTYVQKPKRINRLLSDDDILNLKESELANIYARDKYPEVNINVHNKDSAKILQPNGTPRAYTKGNNIFIQEGDKDEVSAELAHTEQFRKISDLDFWDRRIRDDKASKGDYEKSYEIPGTVEYEAHRIIQPKIAKDYQNYADELFSMKFSRGRTLAEKLGKKKQHGGEIPTSIDGMYEYPQQPVIVPSGDITMEGINYPIDAYDNNTGEFLETMQPDMNYQFNTDEILEIPKAQSGYNRDAVIAPKTISVKGTQSKLTTPNSNGEYTDQFGNVWMKSANGEYEMIYDNKSNQPTNNKRQPTTYSEYLEAPDDKYTVRKGDWLSSIAPMFGMTTEELVKLNPDLADANKIIPGQELNIRKVAAQPVDRMGEVENMQELPEELPVTAEDVIPTLDVKAEDVSTNVNKTLDVANNFADVPLGKLDRTIPTNQLRAMMAANRNISLPYQTEVPHRLFGYNEEDVTPYLDEIDSAVNQQMQNINPNTTQGQAIQANLFNNSARQKRQIINKVNQNNLQRRQQTDNQNVQLENQFDVAQEQSNKNYVDEVQQTLANFDRNKVQQAGVLDDMISQNTRMNNNLVTMGIKYDNFQYDPVTGELVRKATPLKVPKNKWGGLRRR